MFLPVLPVQNQRYHLLFSCPSCPRSMRRTKPITADSFTWNVAKIRMRNTLAQAATNK